MGIGKKLLLLVGLPLLFLLAYMVRDLLNSWAVARDMTMVESNMDLTAQGSLLIHQLQKERGLSVGYLSSKGALFNDGLKTSQQQTRQALEQFKSGAELAVGANSNSPVSRAAQEGILLMGDMEKVRQGVFEQSLSTAQVMEIYSRYIDQLIFMMNEATLAIDSDPVNRQLRAYVNLAKFKEQAGLERAELNNALAQGRFTNEGFIRFAQLIALQNGYRESFLETAPPKTRQAFLALMNRPHAARARAIRRQALEWLSTRTLRDSAPEWFAAQTAKIEDLRQLEEQLKSSLMEQVAAEKTKAAWSVWLAVLAALGAILSLAPLLIQTRLLAATLGQLSQTVMRMAEGEKHRAIKGAAGGEAKKQTSEVTEVIKIIRSISS